MLKMGNEPSIKARASTSTPSSINARASTSTIKASTTTITPHRAKEWSNTFLEQMMRRVFGHTPGTWALYKSITDYVEWMPITIDTQDLDLTKPLAYWNDAIHMAASDVVQPDVNASLYLYACGKWRCNPVNAIGVFAKRWNDDIEFLREHYILRLASVGMLDALNPFFEFAWPIRHVTADGINVLHGERYNELMKTCEKIAGGRLPKFENSRKICFDVCGFKCRLDTHRGSSLKEGQFVLRIVDGELVCTNSKFNATVICDMSSDKFVFKSNEVNCFSRHIYIDAFRLTALGFGSVSIEGPGLNIVSLEKYLNSLKYPSTIRPPFMRSGEYRADMNIHPAFLPYYRFIDTPFICDEHEDNISYDVLGNGKVILRIRVDSEQCSLTVNGVSRLIGNAPLAILVQLYANDKAYARALI